MQKPEGYDDVKAFSGKIEKLPVNGYVCKIMKAEEVKSSTDKDMLKVSLDIAEGDYKGFFAEKYKNDTRDNKKWGCILNQLIYDNEGKTNRGYKALITSIEESNGEFKVTWNEGFCNSLKSKLVGVIFREEEYEITQGKRAGEIGTSVKCAWVRSVDEIRKGNFEVPEVKRITRKATTSDGFYPVADSDDDLPF